VLRDLAHAVRSRRVAARELVTLALDRIGRLDPQIGAVVALRAEEALVEAAAIDERVVRDDDPGPLAGIPCLIKDIEDLQGLPTTHGSLLFRDAPPAAADGLIASRLRAAGAIPVGKANTPEFAAEGFTANGLFGVTRNPWAPRWSPGGSSGGSGAAVAAGMVPIATATDTGGSIRIPGAFCGLPGIKPTNGLIGRDPGLCWPDLTTCGPLAATVDDLRLLLAAEAGPVPGDPLGLPGAHLGEAGLPRRVVAVPRFFPSGPLPEGVEAAFRAALAAMESGLGLPVEWLEPDAVIRSGNPDTDWGVWAAPELVAWLGRERAEGSLDRLFPTTRTFVKKGLRTSIEEYLGVRRRRVEYSQELEELLADDGVIASPTLTVEGWLAEGRMPGSDEPGPPSDVYNTNVQNLTGLPALTAPAGRLPNGVPFGLQFTGPRFRDSMLLDLAEAWETARPWRRAADGYEPFEV
jgi:Asp-tRNA(Asn)/Glu-tRNA(Gln) amidotransferase A subunit family amidase